MLRLIFKLCVAVALVIALSFLVLWYKLTASLPAEQSESELTTIEDPTNINLDQFGIPAIIATNRSDAFTALGYFIARDRMFQADLMRRKSAGTLAEILGSKMLEMDRRQRYLGFQRAANNIVDHLPPAHRQALHAFSNGFNDYLRHAQELPPEFLVLNYKPRQWQPADSILVALGLFQQLTWTDPSERMLTIMNQALDDDVVEFFTPRTDNYESLILGSLVQPRPLPVPVNSLSKVALISDTNKIPELDEYPMVVTGSNNWAVNGRKTFDGRAIVANDMHLALLVPNIWYRAKLQYQDTVLSGVFLPGLPLLIAGTNERVAWGHTNALADVLDLVKLEINPDDPAQYRTPSGWTPFETVNETIKVKDAVDDHLAVRHTIWGPVSPQRLLGFQVAVRWTALQAKAVNLTMLELDTVTNVDEAIAVFNRSGIPPTNVVMGDDRGNIGWTYSGVFPNRIGFDGSTSESWSDGAIGWRGYLPPGKMASIVNPTSGILATANDRVLGDDFNFTIGHDYAYAYRAHHIEKHLKEMENIREKDMLNLQMDTSTEFFEFYRTLALSTFNGRTTANQQLKLAEKAIRQWNGNADPDSVGLPLLVEFRRVLARRVILPYLQPCKKLDKNFAYRWFKYESPLRKLLTSKIPHIIPDQRFDDWHALISDSLLTASERLKHKFPDTSISKLNWGQINQVQVSHPFSRVSPWLSSILDMPKSTLGGCSYCVKVIKHRYGATERLVVSPGHSADAILQMPTGQSGHPLSPHYRDQHPFWEQGTIAAFDHGPNITQFRLLPSIKN